MRKRWNGEIVERDPRQKVDFTLELLEQLGASGKSQAALAKEMKISQQLISKHINKNLINLQAYTRGKQKICQPTHSKNSTPRN